MLKASPHHIPFHETTYHYLMVRNAHLLLLALLLVLLSGCEATEPWVEVKGERYYVEIADTDETRTRGLMFRDELANNRGMLFIFSRDEPRSFWMRNTRIPLDIIYIDSDWRVVSIVHNARPCRTRQCPSYPSTGPARYVLEVTAGHAQRLGLAPGDEVTVGNLPQPGN
ncbi:MAG: DUF192 domain-containing protein [Wenzhouxiangella sp.]|nr:DUF192 domain-containing protein [Wenzhouxiangella sp.]